MGCSSTEVLLRIMTPGPRLETQDGAGMICCHTSRCSVSYEIPTSATKAYESLRRIGRLNALLRQLKHSAKKSIYHGICQSMDFLNQFNEGIPCFNGNPLVCHCPLYSYRSRTIHLILVLLAEQFFHGWNILDITTPKDPRAGKKSGVF